MAVITTTKSVALIVAANTNDNELVFADCLLGGKTQTLFIKVKVGSFKFAIDEVIAAQTDIPTVASTDAEVRIKVSNGERNLHFKAAAGSDAFMVSIV